MYYMNLLRGAMLLGSLGRVWARTRTAKNVYQTISIVAYFKLMSDYENGTSTFVVIPDLDIKAPSSPKANTNAKTMTTRRQNMSNIMKQVNMIINAR